MKIVHLRPHHVICIYFFRGYGYSEEFVENMKDVIFTIKNNRFEKIIQFRCNCDDLCLKCPRKKNKYCIEENRILELDKKTINEYKIDLNKLYSFNDLEKEIYDNFDKEKFNNICSSSCQWYDNICKKLLDGIEIKNK